MYPDCRHFLSGTMNSGAPCSETTVDQPQPLNLVHFHYPIGKHLKKEKNMTEIHKYIYFYGYAS